MRVLYAIYARGLHRVVDSFDRIWTLEGRGVFGTNLRKITFWPLGLQLARTVERVGILLRFVGVGILLLRAIADHGLVKLRNV